MSPKEVRLASVSVIIKHEGAWVKHAFDEIFQLKTGWNLVVAMASAEPSRSRFKMPDSRPHRINLTLAHPLP